jgi:hypothetical protein
LIIISDDFKDISKALTLTIIPSEMGLTTKRMKVEKNKTKQIKSNQIKGIRKGWTLTIVIQS